MPAIVLTNAHITVNSVVLSSDANSVSLTYEVDSVENTGFGSTGHTFQGGLQNVSCEIQFMQDFDAAQVEATVYPLVGTTTTIIVRPNGATTSATNPAYTLSNTYLTAHTPVAAAVGELAMTTLTFNGGTIAKATS
jgi:hypothetical protein